MPLLLGALVQCIRAANATKAANMLTQRTPVANGDSIRSIPAATKAQIVTRICFTAAEAELAAECIPRMVSAVTVDDGKTRFKSRADLFSMKNFLTVQQMSATGRFTK